MGEGIILVDADDASLTVTWPPLGKHPGQYSLQYRPSASPDDNGRDSGGSQLYTSLSASLAANSARKRNLTGAGHGFWFRVSAATKSKTRVDKDSMGYLGHACRRPFRVLTMKEQSLRMAAPAARVVADAAAAPGTYVAHVSWAPYGTEGGAGEDALLRGYKLQMRESDGRVGWSTVAACLGGTEVRKKNLTSRSGYMFRVRPVLRGEAGGSEAHLAASVAEGGNVVPFSAPSDVVAGARPGRGAGGGTASDDAENDLRRLFRGLPKDALLARGGRGRTALGSALADVDLVFLYAAAGHSAPCRKFTPQLVKFYHDARRIRRADPKRTRSVEVVLVGADKSASEFQNHFAEMPWLAVPYEAEARERLAAWMRAPNDGAPKLMCLDGRSGKVLEHNSVGRALDLERFSKYVK